LEVPVPTIAPSPDHADAAARFGERRTIGDFLYGLIRKYEIGLLILVVATVFVFAAICSHYKHFWYDEIFTVIVANQPNLHQFAQAMPMEGNPPMNTLLVRLCIHLLGLSEFSVRLPATVGYCAALVGVFVFVRRECGPVFGLLAVALMVAEPAWMYSFEARPYGLLLGFLMLALVSWQSATRVADTTPMQPRTIALAGMALGIVGCIFSHHIGVVEVGTPLLFGEAVRVYRRRRFDWPLIFSGVFAAALGLMFTLPMAHRTRETVLDFLPVNPSHSNLSNWPAVKVTLPALLSINLLEILVVLVVVLSALWFLNRKTSEAMGSTRSAGSGAVPAYIVSAALGAFLLIPITWLSVSTQNGWYFARYGIGTVAGIAMLACFLLARPQSRTSIVPICLFVLCMYLFLQGFVKERSHLAQGSPAERIAYQDTSTLPMVVSAPLEYPGIWWYAPAPVKDRITYLTERPGSQRFGFLLLEKCLVGEKSMFAAPLQDYGSFIASHDHFLLDEVTHNDSLMAILEADGYKATLLRSNETAAMYDMQRAR